MSELVPTEDIERIVGRRRHSKVHFGRAVSEERIVYILHSQACKDSGIDLRECRYSLALDVGIKPSRWKDFEDRPVLLGIWDDELVPVRTMPEDDLS